MKRVCTLRKVIFSVFKGPLRKVIFIVLKYCGFLSPLSSYCFYHISSREIFHAANLSIFFETCKFLGTFFQKKAIFLMFFIK